MNELLFKLFNSAFSGLIFRKSSATAAAILQLQQQHPSESILDVELPPYSMIGVDSFLDGMLLSKAFRMPKFLEETETEEVILSYKIFI